MTDIVAKAFDNPIFPAIGLALAAGAVALWLAGSWWAYRDATWRTGSWILGMVAAGWVILSTPLLLPLSLGVYSLTRPQLSAGEGRSRRLIAELAAQLDGAEGATCPTCSVAVDPAWLRCPACSTWMAQPCSHCGGWSDRDLEICPWCGAEDRAEPAVEDLRPAASAGFSRKSRRRQARRQPVGGMAYDTRAPRGRLDAALDIRPPARAGTR
jgi:hypothetical protein